MAKSKQKKSPSPAQATAPQHAPFSRRLSVYLLDFLTVLVVLVIASFIAFVVVLLGELVGIIDFSSYGDISNYLAHNLIFASYLALVPTTFYSYFWTVKGQTPAMKLCHLRIQNRDQSNISVTQALIRMATSAFGLGNLFALMQPYKAFQDSWAECEVIVLSPSSANRDG